MTRNATSRRTCFPSGMPPKKKNEETLLEKLKREAQEKSDNAKKMKELAERQKQIDEQDEAEAKAKGPLFYKRWCEERENAKRDIQGEKEAARKKEAEEAREKRRLAREAAWKRKQEEDARKAKWIEDHTKRYPHGGVYFGDLGKNGHPHGEVGDWRRPTGDTMYEGTWHNGKMHGRGKYYFGNGDTFEGAFVGNELHGRGVYTYKPKNKEEYEKPRVRDALYWMSHRCCFVDELTPGTHVRLDYDHVTGLKKDVTIMKYDEQKGKWWCKFERGNAQWVDLTHYKFKLLPNTVNWFHVFDVDDDRPGRNNIFGDNDGNYATIRDISWTDRFDIHKK